MKRLCEIVKECLMEGKTAHSYSSATAALPQSPKHVYAPFLTMQNQIYNPFRPLSPSAVTFTANSTTCSSSSLSLAACLETSKHLV